MTLPYLEQQNLKDLVDMNQPMPSAVNAAARSTRLSFMLCPSDGFNKKPFMGSKNSSTTNLGDNWARGNYGANASLGKMKNSTNTESGAGVDSPHWKDGKRRGIMGANISLEIGEITDGTTNTILLAEMRSGVVDFDARGTWALVGGASAMWAHGSGFDDNGPNCQTTESDDVLGCTDIRNAVGGVTQLGTLGMPCAAANDKANWQQTARSSHSGQIYVALGDGSVRSIGDFIDIVGASGRLSVWDRLNASGDGQPLSAAEF
jgi:hypothetical protein